MFCPKCGYNYGDESSNFCPKCGAPLNNQLAEPEEEEDAFIKKPFRDEYGNRISSPSPLFRDETNNHTPGSRLKDSRHSSSYPADFKPARQKIPGGLIVSGLALCLFVLFYSFVTGSDDSSHRTSTVTYSRPSSSVTIQKEESSKESASSSEPESSSAPDPAPVVYTATSESLEQLFTDKITDDYTEIDVSFDPEVAEILLTYTPDIAWSTRSAVNDAMSNYINYCRYVYAFDSVDGVWMISKGSFTDSHGQESTENVTAFRMDRETFSTFNWDNLEYAPIYDAFTRDCSGFNIHPSVLADIDTDDLYYAPDYDPESFEIEQ